MFTCTCMWKSSEALGNISISASHSIYSSVLVCKMKTLDETTHFATLLCEKLVVSGKKCTLGSRKA